MSTDIVHFQNTESGPFEGLLSSGALRLYLAISLPLVVFTLGAWYLFYLWETQNTDRHPRLNWPMCWQRSRALVRKHLRVSCPPLLPT